MVGATLALGMEGSTMNGIPQRKMVAQGNAPMAAQDFGVAPFSQVNQGRAHPDAGMTHKTLGDGERAVGKPVRRGGGMMPATRHSDHGPHQTDYNFGVQPMKGVQG